MSKIQDARSKKANLTDRQLKFLQDAVANNASAYEEAAKRLNKNYSTVHDTLSDDVYDDRDTRVATQKKLYSIRADEARVDAFDRLFGSGQQKAAPSAYDDLQKYSDALFSTYRPFENADDYTQYMNLLRYDTDAARKQIDSLTEQKKNAPWLSRERSDISKQIDQLEDEIYRAKQVQYPAKVSEYRSNPDFDLYAQRGAQMANPSMQDVFFHPTILGKKIGKQDVVNKVAFGREHADELLIGAANGTAADKEYDYYKYRSMTDDEVATYNYILAKYGTEEADKYLAAMDEELNAREGKGQAQRVGELGHAAELAYMFGAGMENAVQGVRQTVSPELLPTAPSAYGSQIVRDSLTSDGSGWQIAGDLAMSTGNMLPSIALSAMTGGAGPAVGAATMGLGVYGSTYNQARKDGLTERQATIYSSLVAAAEGGLQYLLGGIGKLGGKLTGNAVSKIVKNIDSAFLRIALSGALKAGGEGLEEGLQEILDPLFKGIATGEIDPEWFSTEDVAYSALLGFLSGGMLEGPSNIATNVRTMSIGRSINQSDAARKELLDTALRFNDSANKGERGLYDLAYEMTEGKTHQNDFNIGELAIASQDAGVDVNAIRKKAFEDAASQTTQKSPVSDSALEAEKSADAAPKVAESGFAKSQTGIVETADGNVRVSDISINEVNEDGIILDVTEEDGSIVQRSFDDVEFDDVLAEELFEKAATMDTNTAKAFVMGYDGNVPVSEYTQGFMEIMGAARKGMSLEQIVANGINADVLSPAQRQAAYIAGQNAGRVVDASVSAASVSRGGVVDRTSGLSNTQKRHIDAVDAFAKLIGRRVIIEDRITETPDGVKLSKHVNAYFDPNTNEYHIAKDGIGQAYMFFAVHENIHDIRANNPEAYKKLKGVVFDVLGAERVEAARKIQERLYPNEDADYIDEEIVANTVPAILRDEATAKMMAERVAKADTETRNAFEKLLNGINDLLRKAYNSLRVTASWKQLDSIENDMDAISRIREAYFEALNFTIPDAEIVSKAEAASAYESGAVVVNDQGVAVGVSEKNGDIKMSLSTYETDGRAILQNWLNKSVRMEDITAEDAADIMRQMDAIYKICTEYKGKYASFGAWSDAKVVVDEKGHPVFSVVKKNGDYAMNLDFSTVCKKRRTLDRVLRIMAKRGVLDSFDMSQEQIVRINDIIKKHGFEKACELCFVDAKRFRQASLADDFVEMYNDALRSMIPEGRNIPIASFNFSHSNSVDVVVNGLDTVPDSELNFDKLKQIMRENGSKTVAYKIAKNLMQNPQDRRLVARSDFMHSEGFDRLRVENPRVMKLFNSKKGSGGPKSAFGDVQYLNDILSKGSWSPAAAYAVGGVRVQSFSDYIARLVFDYVQMVGDLAAKELPAHAYTKEALFVKQFGLTGIKINMSLIPKVVEGYPAGLDANGDYAWADESFDYDTAVELQADPEYGKNVGTICVGVSSEHIWKLLEDPSIRMVIPYHKSGLNPVVAQMNHIEAFTNYTDYQNTRYADGKKITKADAKKLPDFNKRLHAMGANGDPVAVSREYVEFCEARGWLPKFDEFARLEDGSFNPNYYKLLTDFALFDETGNYQPQGAVKASFPNENSAFGSMAELIEQGLIEDDAVEARRDAEVDGIVDEIIETLGSSKVRMSVSDADYLDAVNRGDMETAQRMVDKAAKAAGYTIKAYHGTPIKGITVFDRKKIGSTTDDGIFGHGFYFSTSKIVADLYATTDGKTMPVFLRIKNPWWGLGHKVHEVAEQLGLSEDILTTRRLDRRNSVVAPYVSFARTFTSSLIENGYDSVVVQHGKNDYEVAVFDNKMIKAADPVTYDDNGNVIPLSERFNAKEEDIRFSLADTESVDKTKVRSVSSLEKRLAHAKAQLKLTKGVEVNADRIKSLSRKILRQYESKYNLDTFAENLEKVFRYVANTPEPDLDYVYESLNSVSKAALLQSVTKVEDTRAADLKAYFKGKTIYISDTQKAEIESEYGSMSAFRKMLRGTGIKITTDKQYIGNSLDRNYVEMAEMFPSLFEFNTAEGDQPFALVRAFKSVQPIVENPYGMNIDEAANDMTSELLAAYGDEILAKPTFADKQKARFEEMQQKLKADINAVREETKVRSVSSLEKRLAHAKAQLKLTKGVEVNADRIKSLSRKILRQYESKYNLDTFAENLEKVFRYVANTPEPDLDYVYESLNSVSKAALLQSVTKVEDTRAADLKAYFKGKTIYISDTQKAEIESEYGSMSAFRKMLRGTGIKITTDKQYIGNSLDRNYVEMAEMFPSLFEFNTAEGDQPFALVRAFKSVQPIVENPYGMNIDEAANDMTSELLAAYGDEILAKPTFADKQKARFEEMQQKLKADINAVREETKAEYNKVVEALIEMNDRNVASLEQRVKELEQEKSDLANMVAGRIKAEERRKRAAEIDAQKAKYKAQIEQLRSDKNRRMLEIQARNVEAVQEARKTVRERMEKTERARTLRGRIRAKVKSLHKLLLNPTDQKHIPDSMEKAVFDFCQLFTETPGVLFTERQLSRVYDQYAELSEAKGLDIASYDEDIQENLKVLRDTISGKSLAELTNDELQKISDIVDNFKHMVSKENKLFIEGRRVEIATIGEKTLDEARNKGMFKRLAILSGDAISSIRKLVKDGNTTPIYFFKQMGGEMKRLYNDVRNGQDKWAVNMTAAKEFITKTKEKFEYAKWANVKDDTLKFVTARGDSITLTREQAMLIYATRQREIANKQQDAAHLEVGGIVFEDKQREGKYVVDDKKAKPLSAGDIATITGWLTDQQKQYADAMVGYMSNEMSVLGNEVSMRLFGIRKFTEKYYIPYNTSEYYNFQRPGSPTDARLKHMSFTKRTVRKANTPIVVTDFTEVCAGHIQSMCMYNAMTVPLENITRVLNYKTRTDDMTTGESVRSEIASHYGDDALKYIDQLITDINGGVRSDSREGALNKMISLFKKGAVFMSASVAIQQPSAIGRATALVDTKYFLKSIGMKRDYETVKKYAPVAIVKQMGRFDTGTGLSATDWLMEGNEVGFEKAKKKADELGGKLPELMDQVTWSRIFNACVAETKDKTGLTGEALMEAAGKRFRDVVDYTQVYDSVLSRSANMRSNSTAMKMVTSFAAEPTVSYNLLMDAVYSAKTGENGGKKYAARAVGAFVLSVTLNSALKSLVTAALDKDDDESYLEKYVSAFVSNFTQDINPLRLIPVVRDIMSIRDGFTIGRSDMELFDDFFKAFNKFVADDEVTWSEVSGMIGSTAAFVGIPAKNMIRDAESMVNMIRTIFDDNTPTGQGIRLAFEEGLGIDNSAKKQAKRVIRAYLKGDTKEVAQTIADYRYTLPRDLTEQEANRKVESWLKAEIKRMYVDEKITPDQANELLEELVHLTDTKDLFSLYKAWDWEREGGDSENAPTAYTEIYAIVRNKGDITAEMKKLVDAGYEEAYVRGQIQGQIASWFKGTANDGHARISRTDAKLLLQKYTDKKDSEIDKLINQWQCYVTTGIQYDDIRKEYENGKLTTSRVAEMLRLYGGYTAEDATAKARAWEFFKGNPDYDDISLEAVMKYNQYAKPVGVSVSVFADAVKFKNAAEPDYDSDGNPISKSAQKKVWAYIDKLPISKSQKDALHLSFYAKSTLRKAPWN